jgi:addiction module RelE/StbE family toxin
VNVVWTEPALCHLEAIGDYIATENPVAAARVLHRISEATKLLAAHPRSGRLGRVAATRELVVTRTPYIVAYSIRDPDIQILAVYHSARKWPDAL